MKGNRTADNCTYSETVICFEDSETDHSCSQHELAYKLTAEIHIWNHQTIFRTRVFEIQKANTPFDPYYS
jgi:hypothetical protein